MKTLLILILLPFTTFGQTSYTFTEEVKTLQPDKALVLAKGYLNNAENIMTLDNTVEVPTSFSLPIALQYGKKKKELMYITYFVDYKFTADFKEDRYRLRIKDVTFMQENLAIPIPLRAYKENIANIQDQNQIDHTLLLTASLEEHFNMLNISFKKYLTEHILSDDW